MMLKNLTLYRIGGDMPDLQALDERLQALAFEPCGPTQPASRGFVPPRGDKHGALVEAQAGHWIMAVMFEQRTLPAAVVKREVEARADRIEAETGRRPRGKAFTELKEDVVLAVLPRAFTKQAAVTVWIDTERRIMAVDTGSAKRADAAAGLLVEAAGRMNIAPLRTALAPDTAMLQWLATELPPGFAAGTRCELKEPTGAKATVRYTRHPVEDEDLTHYLQQGKRPTHLELTWRDRASFVLTATGAVRAVELFGVEPSDGEPQDAFDADVAIATGELRPMLAELLDALGGALASPIEEAAAA